MWLAGGKRRAGGRRVLPDVARGWETPSPGTVRAELPRIPVLLLAGGHDLSTPLAGARAQAALAPDGRPVVVPAAGHSVQNRAAGDPAQAELARFLG